MSAHADKLKALAADLQHLRDQFPAGKKTVAVHLFGVRCASKMKDLSREDIGDLVETAGLKRSLGAEVWKMIHLADYVQERSTR